MTLVVATAAVASAWEQLDERARAYAEAARAPATLRAYATDWRRFTSWCTAHDVDALPATPHTVALFLADLPGRPSTLRRKLAAIAVMHRAAGHDSPSDNGIVRATFAGIRRERGVAPRPKTALLVDGFATSAARANKSEAAIMRQGRWKSIPVARRYIRAGSRWHDHAGADIGL